MDFTKYLSDNETVLRLNHMDLTEVPIGIFQLKQLKHLELMGNKIINLPDEIGNLSNLEILYLESNLWNIFQIQLGN